MKYIITYLLIILILSCYSTDKAKQPVDISLIVPGISGEGYTLGDSVSLNSFKQKKSDNGNISDITGINFFSVLNFDLVIYNTGSYALYLKNNVLVAITGFKTENRITSDAVPLDRGIDNFIMNYGNKDLLIFSSGIHKAYIYKKLGIAVFDDNNDNTIDMYLIFKNN